jgi:hypothetical protein
VVDNSPTCHILDILPFFRDFGYNIFYELYIGLILKKVVQHCCQADAESLKQGK